MIGMPLATIARALGAQVGGPIPDCPVRRVVTDSRQVAQDDLFIALKGERFDGHEFVSQAVAQGARGVVVSTAQPPVPNIPPNVSCLVVPDTRQALGTLAAFYRREMLPASAQVIAVTGSNGKTTTKFMIDRVLSGSMTGTCAVRSFNNEIGVPLTLLQADLVDQYVLLELGTNAPGEIRALADLSRPGIGVITSIGEAHIEKLGGLEGVAAEKASLLKMLPADGLAVVNVDSPWILPHLRDLEAPVITYGRSAQADVRVVRLHADEKGVMATLEGGVRIDLAIPGTHNAVNAVAALIVGRRLGLSDGEILARLGGFSPPPGRSSLMQIGGVTLVDDAYNANPASMAAAIETARTMPGTRRLFVLGDMFELGARSAALHRETIHHALAAAFDKVVVIGPESVAAAREIAGRGDGGDRLIAYPTCREACERLHQSIREGDTVWVKASHAMGLDLLVRILAERLDPSGVEANCGS